MKKLLILLVILFGVGYYVLDRFILWMHEYEINRDLWYNDSMTGKSQRIT